MRAPSTHVREYLAMTNALDPAAGPPQPGAPGPAGVTVIPRMARSHRIGVCVTVTLTGSGNDPTSVDITYAELAAPQGAGNTKNTHTFYEDGSFGYQLIYDATVEAE